jgi:hypothetical protein
VRTTIAYYYDLTEDHALSSDPEGNLVQLCERCARKHRADVQLAQSGDDLCSCELCDETDEEVE